jgi:hypothetical protein
MPHGALVETISYARLNQDMQRDAAGVFVGGQRMTKQEKRQAAMDVLALRRCWAAEPPPSLPAELTELYLRQLEQLRGVMAELYSEHFSDEQLQALLDFYGSEMGKSIVNTDSEITSRFQERLRDLSPTLNEEASKHSRSVLSTLGSVHTSIRPRGGSG